jgi:hypothetical protein
VQLLLQAVEMPLALQEHAVLLLLLAQALQHVLHVDSVSCLCCTALSQLLFVALLAHCRQIKDNMCRCLKSCHTRAQQ